jgi:hypothetical protein
MMQKMYSIFDKKSEIYTKPFVEMTDGTAVRAITDLIRQQPGGPHAQYSQDYTLYRVGEFDERSGLVSSLVEEKIIELATLTDEAKES